jgi:hypothetical protein
VCVCILKSFKSHIEKIEHSSSILYNEL